MLKQYIDTDGVKVMAQQLEGPLTINTVMGEQTGSCGQWLIYLPNNLMAILDQESFALSFNEETN